MAKVSSERLLLAAIPFAILMIVLVVQFSQVGSASKSAPLDQKAIVAIEQARALQKLGKLNDAFIVFKKYSQLGYPDAMFHAGKAYSRGWGVKPDLENARKEFLQAVQFGHSYRGESAYSLGRLYQLSKGPNCSTIAVEWFKKALRWNFVKASMQLAFHYEKGIGVEQNIKQVKKYYEIAVEAGFEQAMIGYARLLVEGKHGATRDPSRAKLLSEKAIAMLERKARSGSGSAAKQLGRIYRDGLLVPTDTSLAYNWFLHAARMGSTGGMHNLAFLMLNFPDLKFKQEDALQWLRVAAKQGHGGSMTALGRLHLEEKYGLQSSEAIRWFKMGVKADHAGSLEELARLFGYGKLVKKDRNEAIRLANKGSQMGHVGSASLLKELQEIQISKTNKSDHK